MDLLHYGSIPTDLEIYDSIFTQDESSGDFISWQNFPESSEYDTIMFNDTKYQVMNQDFNARRTSVHDWIKGCQILGFIPDQSVSHTSTMDYSATQKYFSRCPRKQTSTEYGSYSIKPAKDRLKINLKHKRKRTIFTTEQIIALEGVFQRKPYVSREERIVMMEKLRVSERAIKVWFQNRRRMTDKKWQEYASDSPTSLQSPDTYLNRLTLIEEQIDENTDENGYVHLDESVISELASIIDYCLSKDVNVYSTQSYFTSTNTEDVLYEPISPASSEEVFEVAVQ